MYPWVVNEIPFYPANASRSSKSTSALAERHCKEVNVILWCRLFSRFVFVLLVYGDINCGITSLGFQSGQSSFIKLFTIFMLCLVVPALIAAFYKIQRIRTRPSHHKDDREIANALYTIVSVAAVISYFLFIGCFIATRRNTYVALITPSESLDANNNDLDKKNVRCLCFAFTVITTLFLCSVAVFYAIIWSQPRNSFFDILATGSLGASVLPWEVCAESRPLVQECSLGHGSREKFWWQICNLLRRELSGFEIFTYGGQHENEARVENRL